MPSLPDQASIDSYFEASRRAGWYSNFGPCVRAFESRASAELLSDVPVVSASNATIALALALRAVFGSPRPGQRDAVVVPSFTFVASVAAITWAGFRPVFVDIDADDWQVGQESLAEALASGTGTIAGAMLTTTFGTPGAAARRSLLEALLTDQGVPFVVDAAAGLGTCPPSVAPGSATVYSLHATKPFAIGEGALIACPGPGNAERIRRLTNFGFGPDHELDLDIGLNAKLPEILGATGLAVLDDFPDILKRRRTNALDLVARLSGTGLITQQGAAESSFQFVPVLCPGAADRGRLLAASAEARIELRTYFDPPMHRVPAMSPDAVRASLPVTDDVSSRVVALPMSNSFSAADADRIVELCRSVLS